jgi:hypothetical protein
MRMTDICDKKTIFHEGMHYLPYPERLKIINGKLAMPYCFYNGKWREDTVYLDDQQFIERLFRYAVKKELITAIPDLSLL